MNQAEINEALLFGVVWVVLFDGDVELARLHTRVRLNEDGRIVPAGNYASFLAAGACIVDGIGIAFTRAGAVVNKRPADQSFRLVLGDTLRIGLKTVLL